MLNCSQGQISGVRRNREKIMNLYNSTLNYERKRQRSGKAPDVEEALIQWYRDNKSDKNLLTGQLLAEKSVELARKLNHDDFVPTNGWISRWKLKYNLLLHRSQKGKDSGDSGPPVPYQDEQSKEASGEEIGSGIIQSKPVLGARVIAKWKDKFYYPGVISRVDKARFQVKFDDGDVLLIKPHDLLLIERLPIGQPVMVPTGLEAFYEGALIVGHVRQGGRTHYTVEQDGGARKQSSQVILNEDQAESLIKDTNCVKSGPASTAEEKIADVTLDNLVEGKRRTGSKYEQGEVDNPPAPPSTQGRKRKYKVDVPPSATSTPTPNRAKRHKVEDPDITPRFGYTAESPAIPKNTRRSPRKSRIGLFDKTSAPTKKIFKGMVFLLTYVEKSSEDRKVEKDFLKDPSLSSDESASESATEELVPFDKARLKNEIEAAGGTVLACYDKDQIPLIKQCYLISNTYQRTVKYFQSLAAGIPCVSHLWIHHCVAQEKVLDYHSYMLQAGISIEKKKIIEWNSRRGVLESLSVLITSSDVQFKQQWSSVLEAAGCHVVQKLPSPTSERPVNVILADKTCTETSLRKYRELPIVGCEWVIQCLINGQRMGFDAHEHYRYDHQV
ncbi:hypothetical protein FSP39_007808 [Pinctada imbricata]|uniref:Uncharacterized protein n=1 Tax=Pinctada imbricata TaxID=66713 RepID=A0AA88YIP7_PINIB|nr:hypothetical protein FSP39_007808 [Pinctada imbricata]